MSRPNYQDNSGGDDTALNVDADVECSRYSPAQRRSVSSTPTLQHENMDSVPPSAKNKRKGSPTEQDEATRPKRVRSSKQAKKQKPRVSSQQTPARDPSSTRHQSPSDPDPDPYTDPNLLLMLEEENRFEAELIGMTNNSQPKATPPEAEPESEPDFSNEELYYNETNYYPSPEHFDYDYIEEIENEFKLEELLRLRELADEAPFSSDSDSDDDEEEEDGLNSDDDDYRYGYRDR